MRTIWTSIGGTLVLCCLAAFLFTAEADMQNNTFWSEVAQGGMTEVMASTAALQRAQSADVKQFAQQMVTDHTAVNEELKTLAASKSVTLPATPSEKQQSNIAKLNARSAADFDREYMKMMVSDHEKTVKLFQRESERGTDAEAKAFAAKTLPAFQGHLTMARTMYDGVKNAKGGSDTNSNMNMNMNSNASNRSSNGNRDDDDSNRYSNKRPNVNRNTNSNMNSNSNRNSNNSNVNNTMMHPF